jgi:hypothetical protein
MSELKSFNGRNVDYFNDDNAGFTYSPKNGEKYVFRHEESNGEFCKIDHFYICCILPDGSEKCRWNAVSKNVTQIYWGSF